MPPETAVHPALSKVLLDEAALQARIKELGAQITRDYAGKRLLVVGVLKGSVIFLADLLRQIGPEVDVYTDFVAVSVGSAAIRRSDQTSQGRCRRWPSSSAT